MNQNDKTAKYYDLVYKDIKGQEVLDTEVSLIKSLVSQDSKILDIGCGTGRHLLPLVNMGYDVFGIDNSDGMLNILKSHLSSSSSLEAIITQSDFFSCKFKKNEYDLAILMWNVFFEMILTNEQIEIFFEIMLKILKPNGKILINIDNAFKINPSKIESELETIHKNIKFKQKYYAKDYDKKTNSITLVENIQFINNEKLVDKVTSEIRQRWWNINEIKSFAEKHQFTVEVRELDVNEELYLVYKKIILT